MRERPCQEDCCTVYGLLLKQWQFIHICRNEWRKVFARKIDVAAKVYRTDAEPEISSDTICELLLRSISVEGRACTVWSLMQTLD